MRGIDVSSSLRKAYLDRNVYFARHDSPQSAKRVLSRILDVADSLARDPIRGSTPQELRELGEHEYRQIFFKPYRLIYRVVKNQVVVYIVADGRRDMQILLARRLLAGG
jgi:toxin ParE1/3/4